MIDQSRILSCLYFVSPIFSLLLTVNACEREDSESLSHSQGESRELKEQGLIFASTYILKAMAQNILDDDESDRVRLIFDHRQDVASSMPSEEIRASLQMARLIILNGADLEKGLSSVDLPLGRTIKTAAAFKNEWLTYPERFQGEQHQHGPRGSHQHKGVDGHTWLSPRLLLLQLDALAEEISLRRIKINASKYQNLRSSIEKLWLDWQKLVPHLISRRLLSNHPAYQYLARDLGIQMSIFDIDPSRPVTKKTWEELELIQTQVAQKKSLPSIMFWESEPSEETRKSLESLDIKHIVVSPLEQKPEEDLTLIEVLFSQVRSLERGLMMRETH